MNYTNVDNFVPKTYTPEQEAKWGKICEELAERQIQNEEFKLAAAEIEKDNATKNAEMLLRPVKFAEEVMLGPGKNPARAAKYRASLEKMRRKPFPRSAFDDLPRAERNSAIEKLQQKIRDKRMLQPSGQYLLPNYNTTTNSVTNPSGNSLVDPVQQRLDNMVLESQVQDRVKQLELAQQPQQGLLSSAWNKLKENPGIAAGIGAGVAGLGGLGYLAYRRNKKKKEEKTAEADPKKKQRTGFFSS
jgi:hypothetical protein